MICEKIQLQGAGDVSLTAYVHEPSVEMPNMKTRPAILVIPGGGYEMCSDREADPVAMPFLAQGYCAFVLRYSVGRETAQWPNPLRDAEQAMRLIRSRAAQWHIDPEKIAAIGFSAGGHLAGALATVSDEKPNALILGYPCILGEEICMQMIGAPQLEDKVTAQTPPTFIFAASNDGRVPIRHSLRFADALDAAGVPFQLHIFDLGDHGFSVGTHVVCATEGAQLANKESKRWVKMCTDWLNRLFDVK